MKKQNDTSAAERSAKKLAPDAAGLAHNPFGGLAALKASLPEAPSTPPPSSTSTAKPAPPRFAEKVVVRKEKKGHGGKTVTVVSGVLPRAHDELCAVLKKSLGTGARVDGDDIVVQGDLADRVVAVLEPLVKDTKSKLVRGS
jgi:translation initiation factor 1